MAPPDPRPPENLSPYARRCLTALQQLAEGRLLSISGAVGLFHYSEFRETKDVDAWWDDVATEAEEQLILAELESTLGAIGEVRTRRFGDVVSVDLFVEGKQVFNFQIARRSVRLRPPTMSPWPPIRLDSLEDLLASKMTALVERGAPRDFVDIHHCCTSGLCTVEQCWRLWQERQDKRGIGRINALEAGEAVLLHLARIEKQRPLDTIADERDRQRAEDVRRWYKDEFCSGKLGVD